MKRNLEFRTKYRVEQIKAGYVEIKLVDGQDTDGIGEQKKREAQWKILSFRNTVLHANIR